MSRRNRMSSPASLVPRPSSSVAAPVDRQEAEARIREAFNQMDPDAKEAFALYVDTLVTGKDRTLDMHALLGEHARAMILHWEQKFGPSFARKGGLL